MNIRLHLGVKRNSAALTVAAVMAVLVTGIAIAAWAPNFSSTPYTGNFYLTTTSNNQVGIAQNIKWSSSGRQAMLSDSNPQFDMTADCTTDNPGGDRLDYIAFYSNVPNFGIQVWNDCGNVLMREEADLRINASSVQAETQYYYQVHYSKKQFGVSGAINLSYQRDNSPTHDHIDKVLYTN